MQEDGESITPALTRSYDKSIRPFIDLIDNLRELGVDKHVALPAIIAVGDQSSGKSSILEAISGVQLPRGSGLITRCPLNMQLIRQRKRKSEMNKNIIWRAEISHSKCESPIIINNCDNVEEEILKAQDILTDGQKREISEELITLKIYSPFVPDLTLIDLPGLVKCAIEGQPADVHEQIQKIVRKYANRKETVILCVIPLNQDSATIEAYQIAKDVDPEGCRTMGVLTKPDLVEVDKEAEALEVAQNKGPKTLIKGYTIVKCRTQSDINKKMPLDHAIKEERAFFEKHQFFRSLDKHQRGIHSLANKLSSELRLHIEKCLPDLENQVCESLNNVQVELSSLPAELSETGEGKSLDLIKCITKFNQYMKTVFKYGELFPHTIFGRKELRLFDKVHSFYVYRIINNQLTQNIQIITNDSFHENIEQPRGIASFGSTLNSFGPQPATPDGAFAHSVLIKEIEKQRGRELPHFQNFTIFENLVRCHILKYNASIQQCKNDISRINTNLFHHIANQCFSQLPFLLERVLQEADIVRKECLADADTHLNFILKKERLVYSQDAAYKEKLARSENQQVFFQNDAKILRNMLSCYFEIANRRISDDIPSTLRICLQQRFAKKLQEKLLSIVAEKSAVSLYAKESIDVAEKRKRIRESYHRLHEAKNLISSFKLQMASKSS